jgi:hypothetical protein
VSFEEKKAVIVVAFINLSGLSLFMLVCPICGMGHMRYALNYLIGIHRQSYESLLHK